MVRGGDRIFGPCVGGGSWLSSGKTIALSETDLSSCAEEGPLMFSMSSMAAVGKGQSFGSAKKPGYLSAPEKWNGTWNASHE
jgi:hypothetical protein